MIKNNRMVVGTRVICVMLLGSFIALTSCSKDEGPIGDVKVSSISIKGDFIEDGGTRQLTAVVLPEEAAVKEVEWNVSNESVATIDQNGLLTAVANGILTVTATAIDGSGVSGTKSFNVSGVAGPLVLVESIDIQTSSITDGQPVQLVANVSPSDASNKVINWSISNEAIGTVSSEGVLTPLANGTVEVTATATDGSGIVDSKSIDISGFSVLVASITVQATDITDGQPQQLSVEVAPSNASNQEVEWSVSDASVAQISTSGILTPIGNGTVTVIASATDGSEISGSSEVVVSGVTVTGTIVASASEILSALDNANAGDVIYVRQGTYAFNSTIRMDSDGQNGNLISFLVFPGDDRPVFDFSSMSENSSNRGVSLSGDYWYVKGIEIYKAGDNGMNIRGNNNLIEYCAFYENADSGLQIGNGGANNTILNCDSYFNADSSIENADGFAAKLDCGTGNKFIGCRAWNNLDDGWDGYLRGTDNITTTYENCWAFRNGYLKDGSLGGGDGNGFKTGGSDDKQLKHNAQFRNCIAAGNSVDGFDHNSNRGDILIYNSSAHSNGRNFSFGTSNIAGSLTVKNSLSLSSGSSDQLNATSTDITNNGWQNGINTTAEDFNSLDIDQLLADRNPDGSLPDITYLNLVQGSDLIDAGVDVGLDFNGSAPDIGAFEFE